MSLRFLVAESEPPQAREQRRESVGRSSGETFVDLLRQLTPGARADRVTPADSDAGAPSGEALAGYDAVFLTGSPLHVYQDTPEVRRQLDFMRAVFRAGTPSFGSCAGLQVAVAAAGGRVRSMGRRREAGFARRITPTDAGRVHPLLAGRPPVWDAITVHSDEVEQLPPGATRLALNAETAVQAVEIRREGGVFWGTQYHPELSLEEAAAALSRDADELVEAGLVLARDEAEVQGVLVAALGREPSRRDLAWRLGLDGEVADPDRRRTELRNFVRRLVLPTRSARGRE